MSHYIRLGVNVDHVATLRQARGTRYPDPVQAALLAEEAGADGITVHPREDQRHIQRHDVERMRDMLNTPLNLEMAVTESMLTFAERITPAHCCLVPEKREELTTEGGLDVASQVARIKEACGRLAALGSNVSLFIDPDPAQIDAAVACGAPTIELHTGEYANATQPQERDHQLRRLQQATAQALGLGLRVNGGHGLHYHNTRDIAAIPGIHELNIGHAIIARALFVGLKPAVAQMRALLDQVALEQRGA